VNPYNLKYLKNIFLEKHIKTVEAGNHVEEVKKIS
jgi:hypothetical protein